MRVTISAPSIDEVTVIPEHPEGEDWTHILHATDDEIVFADTATEAVGAVIGADYDALDDSESGNDEALGMRYDAAVGFAAVVQHVLNQTAFAKGRLDPAVESEHVLTALHQNKRTPWIDQSATGGFGGGPHWEHPVPLVLITTNYAPYTELAAPTGNIIWIDPALETGFLASLYATGLVDYRILADTIASPELEPEDVDTSFLQS